MKNLLLAIALTFTGLVGCQKDEISDIQNDLNNLQDSLNLAITQHEALLDSISGLIESMEAQEPYDINALKMSQTGSLFESIARQPEVSNTLISATEMLYLDYTELLPFSDSTIIQRGYAVMDLFEAIARQPEAYEKLDRAATKFLGEFDPAYMSTSIVEGKARGIALSGLFEGIARQPEAYEIMDTAATKFLGSYNSAPFSNELIEISKGYSMSGLNQALTRQPKADSLFNLVCIKFLNFNFLEQ